MRHLRHILCQVWWTYSCAEVIGSPRMGVNTGSLAPHRCSVGIAKKEKLFDIHEERKWRYCIERDLCAVMWWSQLNFRLFEVVPEKQQDHFSPQSGMHGHISARRNSSWSRPFIWMEWMSSLCGYPLCQRALCHIFRCAPCLFCLSLHYSIP